MPATMCVKICWNRSCICVLIEHLLILGRHQGALVQISDMVEGCNPLLVYCLNHCLELAIKDAYKKIAVLMT